MTWNAVQAGINAIRAVGALLLCLALLRSGQRRFGWWGLFRRWPLRAQLSVGLFALSWALPMAYSAIVLAFGDLSGLTGPLPAFLAALALVGVAQLAWRVYRGTLLDPPP